MSVAPNRYPPAVAPFCVLGNQEVRALAHWEGIEIVIAGRQHPLTLTPMQALELSEWLHAAVRAIDQEG